MIAISRGHDLGRIHRAVARPGPRRNAGKGSGRVYTPGSTARRSRTIFETMQRLDLTDNERAALIVALRRLVEPQPLSPQNEALRAILERLEPQRPRSLPADASTG